MEFVEMGTFKSKKNNVRLILRDGCQVVLKQYSKENVHGMDVEAHVLLKGREAGLAMPDIMEYGEDFIVLSYIPGVTAMDIVNCGGPRAEACVRDIALWLRDFHCAFQDEKMIMGDCNLRNFVVSEDGVVSGVDFEEGRMGEWREDLGVFCAHLLAKGDMFSLHRRRLCEIAVDAYSFSNMRVDNLASHVAEGLEYFGRWRPDGSVLFEKAKVLRERGWTALGDNPSKN